MAFIHPGKYKQQAKQYVGNGQSVDYQTAGYDQGSEEYRNYILGLRDKNFTAVDAQEDPQAEWRLVQENGTGRQYWRHYDAAKGQYDTDLFDAATENDPAAVLKRQAPQDKAGVYDEGEQVTLQENPYPPGTPEFDAFARTQHTRALDARAKHYTPADRALSQTVTGAADGTSQTSYEYDPAQQTAEWRALRNNNTLDLRNRHYNEATGQYDLQLGRAYNAYGVVGGAGNRVAGMSADNSWDENKDGADVRTASQKFYDRTLSNYTQTADASGHYSWYGDEYGAGTTSADRLTGNHRKTINLDEVQDPTKPTLQDGEKKNYWDYNGAPDKGYFEDQIRSRANKSNYARTL